MSQFTTVKDEQVEEDVELMDQEHLPPIPPPSFSKNRKNKKPGNRETVDPKEKTKFLTKKERQKLYQTISNKRVAEKRKRELELLNKAKKEGVDAVEVSHEELLRIEEKYEKQRRRKAEYVKKRRRDNVEQRQKRNEKAKFKNLVKKATMTEEELQEHRIKMYFYKQAYAAKHGTRYWELPPEEKRKLLDKNKRWRENLPEDKKERHKENQRKAVRKFFRNMKMVNPEKYEEFKEKNKINLKARLAKETLEEKNRRVHRYKVNSAKTWLRKRLEKEGVDRDEIERRTKELWERKWREYDPNVDLEAMSKRGRKTKKKVDGNTETQTESTSMSSKAMITSNPVPSSSSTVPGSGSFPELPVESIQDFKEDDYTNHFDSFQDESSSPPSPPPSPPSSPPCLSPPSSPPCLSPSSSPTLVEKVDIQLPSVAAAPILNQQSNCSHCSAVFPGHPDLRQHMLIAHPKKCWKCPKCMEYIWSPSELLQHFQTVHKLDQNLKADPKTQDLQQNSRFVCMRCSPEALNLNDFSTREELFDHVEKFHASCFWPCELCNLLKYSRTDLETHQKICFPRESYRRNRRSRRRKLTRRAK